MSTEPSVSVVDTCRVCGHREFTDVISFGPSPLADGFLDPAPSYPDEHFFPLDVIRCGECGLMCLRHVVRPDILFEEYAYVSPRSEQMAQHMGELTDRCADRYGVGTDDLVVELGSNIGLQLAYFGKLGARMLGVDPARNLAQVANDNGIPTLPLYFGQSVARDIRAEYGPAALVLGRHVVAHVPDLPDVIAGVRDLLDTDGVFVMECPYLLDLLAGNQFDTIYHEHLSYFSIRTLVYLFERFGMRVIDVARAGVHGGSIVVTAAARDSRWPVSPMVAELVQLELDSGLADERTYREFAERVGELVPAITGLVRGLVADGKRVAAYGAPAKGTMLLAACGFGPDDLIYSADTTDIKHGKVTPGSHLPVRPPSYAQTDPPDYYLLLSWNYAEEILRKERDFLARGGRFIIPVPQPRVVSAADVPVR